MVSSNFVVGALTGVPPSFVIVALSASTCSCSDSPNFLAIEPTFGSLTMPLAMTCL